MTFPVVVSFQQMAPSAALRSRVRELAERLERFSPNILRCRVWIERPARHKEHGVPHAVRVDVAVPDEHILVGHTHAADPAHEDPYVAVRDAFNAARRQLENYERRRRGQIKRHHGLAQPAPKPIRSATVRLETAPRVTASRVSLRSGTARAGRAARR
ncbi:MAG: HPF/RaiA family ribosome-associated protein [Steroidobacteraceae bacterium]